MSEGTDMDALLVSEGAVWEVMREVYDPELGVNVVDLGLVYDVDVQGGRVEVTMTLTTPGCPLHDTLTEAVDSTIRFFIPGVEEVVVNLVWEPPWNPDMITDQGREELGSFW
jgi:metal-sulfur cluster biosynthetic enzyme